MYQVSLDTLVEICYFLQVKDIAHLVQTHSHFLTQCSNDRLWNKLVERDLPLLSGLFSHYIQLKFPDIKIKTLSISSKETYQVWTRRVYVVQQSTLQFQCDFYDMCPTESSASCIMRKTIWDGIENFIDVSKVNVDDLPVEFCDVLKQSNFNLIAVQNRILHNYVSMYDKYSGYVRTVKSRYVEEGVKLLVSGRTLMDGNGNVVKLKQIPVYQVFQSSDLKEQYQQMMIDSGLYPIPI